MKKKSESNEFEHEKINNKTESVKVDYSRANIANYVQNQCRILRKKCINILNDDETYKRINGFKKYLLNNPILLWGFGLLSLTLVVPVFLFTLIIIINIAIAFTGFVVIEAMVLTSGITLLCCALFFFISTVLILAICFSSLYYMIYRLYNTVKNHVKN